MTLALRFTRYVSVAAAAAGGDWLVFAILASIVGISPLIALMTARLGGGLISFLGNRYWTWTATRRIALSQQGRRFVMLYSFSYVLSVALFRLLTALMSVPPYPSKLVTDLSCFIVNFLVMNAYVFHARAGLVRLFVGAARAPNGMTRPWQRDRDR